MDRAYFVRWAYIPANQVTNPAPSRLRQAADISREPGTIVFAVDPTLIAESSTSFSERDYLRWIILSHTSLAHQTI